MQTRDRNAQTIDKRRHNKNNNQRQTRTETYNKWTNKDITKQRQTKTNKDRHRQTMDKQRRNKKTNNDKQGQVQTTHGQTKA